MGLVEVSGIGITSMKLNISYPANGTQKSIDIDDEHKLRVFYEKRMGQEVEGDSVGDEFKGYIFRITGGNDKQGFPMKQGVTHPTRVKLLLAKGHSCYRPRRTGERIRKFFGLSKEDDVRQFVVRREVVKGDKKYTKAPKIQRLVTPQTLQRKRALKAKKIKNAQQQRDAAAEYAQLLAQRLHT